jgi:gluconolactonase
MRRSLSMLPGVIAGVALAAGAAATPAHHSLDSSQRPTSAGIPGVLAPGTRVQLLGAGFNGTEGALGLPDGSIIFCEFNANRLVHIDGAGHFSTYLQDSNRPLGLGYDAEGRLIAAESRNPRLEVLAPVRKTLADSFEGQPLVRPNDLVVDGKGGIYFTDPIPNRKIEFRAPPPGRKPLLFYITPRGRLTKLTDAVTQPNGIELSPDGKVLYAVDGARIVAFDVQANGMVKEPRAFANVTGDGLAMDSDGRLYAATTRGIEVIDPKGRLLGLIATPTRIQSMAFGGGRRDVLYAVGGGSVYRIALLAHGVGGRAK